jgi:hypothetical protein
LIVQISANIGDDLRSGEEDVSGRWVHDKIKISLAVPLDRTVSNRFPVFK